MANTYSRRNLLLGASKAGLVALTAPLLALSATKLREEPYAYTGSFRIAQGPLEVLHFTTKDGGYTWKGGETIKWPKGVVW